MKSGHECVVFDRSAKSVQELVCESALGASDLRDMIEKLASPRTVWLMVPAAAVDQTVDDLAALLEAGDTIIDGGNSYYVDDMRRAKELARKGIHYVDVGTSGGVWGLERGYCMMIGGEKESSNGSTRFSERSHPARAILREHRVAQKSAEPPKWDICIAVQTARAISSRWFTTESSTA